MSKRLHVANLAADTTATAIREAFGRDGRRVERVDLVMSREPGRSRGFAFVEMVSDEDAREAIRVLNGSLIGSRDVRVSEARALKSRFGGELPETRRPVASPAAARTAEA